MAPHFTPKAPKFLKQLEKNNDRDWFNERKSVYEAELKAPLLAVIAAVNEAMPEEFVRDPAKIAMRIYRDIRFSKDKRPYKHNVAAWWARAGMEKTSGAGYYFQLDAKNVMVAAGCYMPERDQLLKIRRMIVERHGELAAAMKIKGMEPFEPLKLTRAPKGFAPDGPGADLILQRQWGVSASLPIETALGPGLVAEITRRFQAAAGLVQLLNEPLLQAGRKALL